MKSFHSILIGLAVFFAFTNTNGQKYVPVFAESNSEWADSVMATLSLEERIGQLFMVAAYSNKGADHEASLRALVEDHNIGGLIFFQGGPLRQAHMTNRLQASANVPLWIGMDAEWGLAMRLDSTIKYPRQMTMGALENDTLIYRMGQELAGQMK
ncbi:MAG TPA: glycoside hydrolase family 3 N-terminal domain-containing protein, partial [Cryomorphaceae bacterium]|nr:glycoside hydrolase family 3 N-terminal domain-containing protein [Cryomorphaceae bacterium]